MHNMNDIVGKADIVFVVFDALRYDAAQLAFEQGKLPNLSKLLPKTGWEKRHTPGSFTYPAHQAFFAGFLPTPIENPKAERLFAPAFEGSETTGSNTFAFKESNWIESLKSLSYLTLCIGGVGFFNQRTEVSKVLPSYFEDAHWTEEFGVTDPASTANQFAFAAERLAKVGPEQRVCLFINLSALHQPNFFYVPGRTRADGDDLESHIEALAYVDAQWPTLLSIFEQRGDSFHIYCSDHGTAYGEGGYYGHRHPHPTVMEVPYTKFYVSRKIKSIMKPLAELLDQGQFLGYSYAYPHKTAYRELLPELSLQEIWADEDKSALFLYVHIPFCEMRCGFCNLFTLSNPKDDMVTRYLLQLEEQFKVVSQSLGEFTVARMAIGGGTPTYLTTPQLERLFALVEQYFGAHPQHVPTSIESSPGTIDDEKIALFERLGIERVSIGIQSFVGQELKDLGRLNQLEEINTALRLIKDSTVPILNIDMIYGGFGQTRETWTKSLEHTLSFEPEEIYLYPLYVRPLTGLDKMNQDFGDDERPELYRIAQEKLKANGYEQGSMRMFTKPNRKLKDGLAYGCQKDGMVGLGAGARSYTSSYHYSSEYGVERKSVKGIIEDFCSLPTESFAHINYGIHLDEQERKHRYIIKSILHREGLSAKDYRDYFGTELHEDFPMLRELINHQMATFENDVLLLNQKGLDASDVIGPWLYSDAILERMNAYELT